MTTVEDLREQVDALVDLLKQTRHFNLGCRIPLYWFINRDKAIAVAMQFKELQKDNAHLRRGDDIRTAATTEAEAGSQATISGALNLYFAVLHYLRVTRTNGNGRDPAAVILPANRSRKEFDKAEYLLHLALNKLRPVGPPNAPHATKPLLPGLLGHP